MVFGDPSNGTDTYGGGRFLSVDPPDSTGQLFLDFNRATNPPCLHRPGVVAVQHGGVEVGPNEIGELVVRGSNVMQGYWNDPEETNRKFRPGRYRAEALLYTGDLFKKDGEGFLYFVSRKDDLIKTKGERVSPKEIENTLCEMDNVSEAVVIGVPDEIFGQAIKAFIIRDKDTDLTEKSIMKYCTTHLEPFMVPKHIEFRESFPKSSSGKIDKKQLK